MPISREQKFIFVHVSKTGGTSIKRALSEAGALREDRAHLWGRIPSTEEARYEGRWWQHLPAWQIRQMVSPEEWQTFFRFAFVRNPWDRAVSDYFYARKASREIPSSEHYGRIYPDSFLEWFKDRTPLIQSEFICDPSTAQILVDFVGRFENLARDFQTVCDRIGLSDVLLPHKNSTRHRPYREYYDDEARAKVERVCAADTRNFGYTF